MARRFRGESHHKVDVKGRVAIPALFRRVLEAGDPDWKDGLRPQLVIVYGDHRQKFLQCYTIEAIDEVDAKIDAMPRGSVERKMVELMINGQSLPSEVVDGRLGLPQKLRDKIGLGPGEEAFFIAAGDTFQIWKPDTYQTEELAKTEAWRNSQPEGFDPLSLLDQKIGE